MSNWKEINRQRLAQLHPIFAERLQRLIDHMEQKYGVAILVTQALRTWAEQNALFAKGRTAPGPIVTKAPGGHSHHNFKLGADLCPDDPNQDGLQLDWNEDHPVWKQLLEAAPQFGLAEGAKWRSLPDSPHFYPAELPATTEQFRAQYQQGGQAAVDRWFESLVAAHA